MSAIQLREGVWSVGVLNPSLRVFDIVMESKYGTSYNAYLLTGEKNVLIETVHRDFFPEYLDNIRSVIPLEQVDYLIMNHTEPDHSGSVAALLELCPRLTVICSSLAKRYLSSIANREFPCTVAADGDTLDLGNRTLHFISAPLLHWPDTMFTWDPADQTLFTCDFLGCHYCQPTMLDTDLHPAYQAAYDGELRNYFDGIFGPFHSAVLKGLDKIPAGAELVCTAHGPCLTKTLGRVTELYRQWATPVPKTAPTAAVLYCSAYGYTAALAQVGADALKADGYDVTVLDLTHLPASAAAEIANTADVVLVGAPTINRAAPETIWGAVHAISAINTNSRAAGAFGSYGWSGEAADMLHSQLSWLRFRMPEKPFKVNFQPTQADLDAMAAYARQVAALADATAISQPKASQKYICKLCGYIYDPAAGDPDRGVAPGTPFEDVPKLWTCPLCGMDKAMFKPVD